MTRQLSLPYPFDLALTLTMGQAFRWRSLGDGWFSGAIGENLVHIICSRSNSVPNINDNVEEIAKLSGRTVSIDGQKRYPCP